MLIHVIVQYHFFSTDDTTAHDKLWKPGMSNILRMMLYAHVSPETPETYLTGISLILIGSHQGLRRGLCNCTASVAPAAKPVTYNFCAFCSDTKTKSVYKTAIT